MKNRSERITVTLPVETIQEIDRFEKNRSKFVAAAVAREIERRLRDELRKSLTNPHPDSVPCEAQGLEEWANRLPREDAQSLVSLEGGKPIRWLPEQGWVMRDEKEKL